MCVDVIEGRRLLRPRPGGGKRGIGIRIVNCGVCREGLIDVVFQQSHQSTVKKKNIPKVFKII